MEGGRTKEEKAKEYAKKYFSGPDDLITLEQQEELKSIEAHFKAGFEAGKQERYREIIEKLEKRYLEVTESEYDGMRVTGWRDAIDYLIENLSK